MKIDNHLFWIEIDKNHVVARSHISSVCHDLEKKVWLIRYTGGFRELGEKEGKAVAKRLGLD